MTRPVQPILPAGSFVLAGCLLAAALGGCSSDPTKGYTLEPMYEPGVASVAVPIVTRSRDVYHRELEFRLTEALKKRISLDTPYKILPRSEADTELNVTIELIRQNLLTMGNPDTGGARELEQTMFLSLTWKDLRTGRTIRKLSNIRVAGTYVVDPAFDEDFFQGSEDVINTAARRVVEQMEREM